MNVSPSWLRSRPGVAGPLGVLIVIAFVESARRLGVSPPLPFLPVFGAVVLAAKIGGLRSAIVSAALMALFIVYSTIISFGSPSLTGAPFQASVGIAFIFAFALLLGRGRDVRLRASEREERVQKRREAIAELSQRALEYTDLDALFGEAVALLAGAFRVQYCAALELLPGGETLLVRAGVGWPDKLLSEARIPAGPDSLAGYTLLQSEPVVVEDLRIETRFPDRLLLADSGAVSAMSIVIEGDDTPFGSVRTLPSATRSPTTTCASCGWPRTYCRPQSGASPTSRRCANGRRTSPTRNASPTWAAGIGTSSPTS